MNAQLDWAGNAAKAFATHDTGRRGNEASPPASAATRANEASKASKQTTATPIDWSEPCDFVTPVTPLDYPLDALPDGIKSAVQECVGFRRVPVGMAASCALAALSASGQALVDVRRAERLEGPSSLYFLVVADSGERKSSVDDDFMPPIDAYENEVAAAMAEDLAKNRAAIAAWRAEVEGVDAGIRRAAAAGDPVDELRQRRERLECDRPSRLRVPIIRRGECTTEKLRTTLHQDWPSGAIIESEAGIIFGGHAMRSDTVLANLATLNKLWDGAAVSVGRQTSESFKLVGARLTVGLQSQAATLRAFDKMSGNLSRGSGFYARFLIAMPVSTMGTRLFNAAPPNSPALAVFRARIGELLRMPPIIDQQTGALRPLMLTLDPEAFEAWRKFHDDTERQLSVDGDLRDVRDCASKVADNAARIAALLHLYIIGPKGSIGGDTMERAIRVAAWHLHEARRLFGTAESTPESVDAVDLDRYLLRMAADHQELQNSWGVRWSTAMTSGPNRLRAKKPLTAAFELLAELGRARLIEHAPGGRWIAINPALRT